MGKLDIRLELAQLSLDIAGIVDPTPTADLLGAAVAVYRGSFWDALASVAGASSLAGSVGAS